MATICTVCKKEYEIDTAYCTECGAKTMPKGAPVTPPAATPVSIPAPQPPADNVVGTGTYFGLMFLFGIPLIGFIACILMCFLPKNKNIKHFAQAQLIWSIISMVVTVLLVVALSTALTAVATYLSTALPEELGDLYSQVGGLDVLKNLAQVGNVEELNNLLGGVDWSQADMGQLQPLLDQLGVNDLSELQPVLEQLGVNDFSDLQPLLEQLEANDLSQLDVALDQMGVDDLSELQALMERYEINSIEDLSHFAAQF